MNRRIVGCAFVAIAAFLFTARYITAAIFISNIKNWGQDIFQRSLSYVGGGLHVWAVVALLTGIVYLAWGEYRILKNHEDQE